MFPRGSVRPRCCEPRLGRRWRAIIAALAIDGPPNHGLPVPRERGQRGAVTSPLTIYVDADACPVKDEVYRVAARYGLHVFVVANAFLNVPREPWIERVIVPDAFDAADDWIAERAGPSAIVVTADVPLANRCVKAGASVLAPNGKAFTDASVGMALATRNLMQELREAGAVTGGPRPFSRQDRSAFLGALDRAVVRLRRTVRT
jgi:uncharacterized protein